MKNNKGLTLVELIISIAILAVVILEIFNLMSNTSVIFKNGTYDIGLMTEASQAIAQFEELAIDSSAQFSYATNSATITYSDGTVYNINLIKGADAEGNPLPGNLMLSKNGGANQIMAEYVDSFEVNTQALSTDNKITLVLHMKRERSSGHYYTYDTTKDIYIRNRIGTDPDTAGDEFKGSGGSSGGGSTVLYEYSLNVLRFHKYDLTALYGDYTYQWDPDTPGDLQHCCNLSGSSLETTAAHNTDLDCDKEGYIIALNGEGNMEFRIRAYPEQVQIGMSEPGNNTGYLICYFNGDTNTTVRTNLAMFRGISCDPEDIGSVKVELIYSLSAEHAGGKYVDYFIDFVEDPMGLNGSSSDKVCFVTTWNFFEKSSEKLKDSKGNVLFDEDGDPIYGYKLRSNGDVGWIRFGAQNCDSPKYEAEDYEDFKILERRPPLSMDARYDILVYHEDDISEKGELAYHKIYFGDDKSRLRYKIDGAGEKELWFRPENSYLGFNADSNAMFVEGTQFFNSKQYAEFVKLGNQCYLRVTVDYGMGDPMIIKCVPAPAGGDVDMPDFFDEQFSTDGTHAGSSYYEPADLDDEKKACEKINEEIFNFTPGSSGGGGGTGGSGDPDDPDDPDGDDDDGDDDDDDGGSGTMPDIPDDDDDDDDDDSHGDDDSHNLDYDHDI